MCTHTPMCGSHNRLAVCLGKVHEATKMPFSHTHDTAHVSPDSALDVSNRRAREQRSKRDVQRVAKAAVRPSRTLRQQTLRNVRSCGCVEAGKLCVCKVSSG